MAVKVGPRTGPVGMTISLDSSDLKRKISRLIKVLDIRFLLEAIGNRHLEWMNENLDAAGTEKKHQIMSPNTIAVRPQRSSSHHFSSRYLSRLKQSLTKGKGIKIESRSVTVGTEDEFAHFHHFGTKPYTIRPKTKGGFLVFKTADGMVMAREVHHPGIPARPFLPSKAVAEKLAIRILEASYKKMVKDAGLD